MSAGAATQRSRAGARLVPARAAAPIALPAPGPAAPRLLTGTRVRIRWPDGELTRSCGVITHLSPCKAYPEVWPLGERCGYLPEIVSVTAWRASWTGSGQPFLRQDGDHLDPDAVTARELQRRQFADDRRPPVIGCEVRWDARIADDGELVMLPASRVQHKWAS